MWTMAENINKLKVSDTFENGSLFESANKVGSQKKRPRKNMSIGGHEKASAY